MGRPTLWRKLPGEHFEDYCNVALRYDRPLPLPPGEGWGEACTPLLLDPSLIYPSALLSPSILPTQFSALADSKNLQFPRQQRWPLPKSARARLVRKPRPPTPESARTRLGALPKYSAPPRAGSPDLRARPCRAPEQAILSPHQSPYPQAY